MPFTIANAADTVGVPPIVTGAHLVSAQFEGIVPFAPSPPLILRI
jgi:hypothetical protein